jgi:Zn-dependent peptidase ImmA (M78 family)
MKLGEYKSFLHFVKERTPELKDLDIQIVKGDQFSNEKICDYFVIDTIEKLNDTLNVFTCMYFEDKINQNIYWFERNYNEIFVLLHEIGHIVTRKLYSMNDLRQEYNSLKENTYNTTYEAFTANRQLPVEVLVDNFAIEFTNKYFYEIVKYFTGMNKEDANSFINIMQ